MSQTLAQPYDTVRFPSLPIARSQPDFLASVAQLRGVRPTAPSRARVLELGCAAGQNLLPLAERFPEANFVGVDISPNEIAAAKQLAGELDLSNVEFRQQDILAVDATLGTFDYVVAHGVYSWVERPVREKLLTICRENLAPQGVAYVNYKTYPGWRLHDMVRHMMLYDSRNAASSAEKMTRVRMFLDFLSQCFDNDTAYGHLVRQETQPLALQSDAYLWHDHLAPVSHPVRFEQFASESEKHDLQILGEATLGIRPTDSLDADLEQQLAAITSDPIKQEQLRDMVRNRALRQSLLCHREIELGPTMSSELLLGMYLAGNLRPTTATVDLASTEVAHFTSFGGARVGTALPLAKAALLHLGEIWPSSIKTEELLSAAVARIDETSAGATLPPDSIHRLRDNLLHCCLAQVVQVRAEPDAFVPRPSDRPMASPLARWRAARTDIVANRRHDAVKLDSFDRHVLCLLDGEHDTDQLLERLVQAAEKGQLVVTDSERHPKSGAEVRQAFAEAMPEALNRLANSALLIA